MVRNFASGILGYMLIDCLGAGLVLRQLGLRISYPAGSVVLIRGHELAHSTTQWTKESRFVVVQTTHEASREHAYRNLGRPYPPLALAPNFENEAAKKKRAAAAKRAREASAEQSTTGPHGRRSRPKA